jgi:hypothetical protein
MDKEVSNRSEHMKEFVNKVAEKLGVPADKVAAAMRDVRKEWMDQMIKEKIQEAVQKGIITQAEAGSIREWLKNRPDGVQKLLGQMFGHRGGMMGSRM